jgi:hypothetical protein
MVITGSTSPAIHSVIEKGSEWQWNRYGKLSIPVPFIVTPHKQALDQQADKDSHKHTVDDGDHSRRREEHLPPGYSHPYTPRDTFAIDDTTAHECEVWLEGEQFLHGGLAHGPSLA